MQNQHRQLAAILFTDIVGYTALMQENEQKAVALIQHYNAVLEKEVTTHNGNVLNNYGDGSLCSFSSATQAIRCSVLMQQQLQMSPVVPLRIGLHIGEIFFEDGKVLGDAVNLASRIQSLGQANTILFSREIFDKIRNQPEFSSISLGFFEFKNVSEPMEVFALKSDGLMVPRKEEMTGKLKETQKKNTRRKWILAASAIILFILAAFFISGKLKNKKGFTGKERSIVVLPFDNYSNDPEQEGLINGITEEITTQLAKIADIKVIGRNSAVLFKKSNSSLDQISDILGVAAYLEGSLQKYGKTFRITAQLIDATTKEHIWADRYDYDGNMIDIFSMQSEVAEQIAAKLHAKLTDAEKSMINKKPTDNIEAYKFYRKGRFFWDQRTKASFDSAEIYYKKAIELDPDYALAYSGLADLYIFPNNGLSQRNAMPIAREFATKALLLDSSLGESLTTIGFVQSAYDYDWGASKKTLEKAISLNSNYPTTHLYYGNLLQYTGENTQQGINEIKKAVALDPLSVNLNYALGRNYYLAHKYDSAYDQFKKALTLNPGFNLARGNLIFTLLAKKNYPEAFEEIKHLDSTGPAKVFYYKGAVLSYAYAVAGDKVRAKSELEKTIVAYPDQSSYHLACVYILLGDYNEALTRLEKAYEARDLWMYIVKCDPALDPIRNEPRFRELMSKMHLK